MAVRAVAKTRKTANNLKNIKTLKPAKSKPSTFKDCYDPNGSYTGTPIDGGKPVQDADDL